MKKKSSQISLGVVCAALGFMVVYQLKSTTMRNSSGLSKSDKEEIMLEIDNLKSEKKELTAKNANLSKKLDEIEKSAVEVGEVDKMMKDNLDKTRMILGQEDIEGEGIILSITLKSPLIIGQNASYIRDYELAHIVNALKFSGTQAISINDYRITQQTGIKNASDFIWIGEEGRVLGAKPIEIKAIGDINKLKAGITFGSEMEFGNLRNYDYKIEEVKELKIKKSNVVLATDYLKKSEEE
ncbi:MAG: DUF881 domain-containing protein [Sarcina sp.]